MRTWRERATAATAVAAILVAGGGLAAGIHNALFEAKPVRAGSFTPGVVSAVPTSTTSTSSTVPVVEETTTTTVAGVGETTTTVRRTATTAARVATTTSTTAAATSTTSTTRDNRGRGRGGPPDD